ncbi:hypothetical protein VP01_379g4 [Puccinia sorghi]|uniref:Uncharacterized protein n=1 Tax=Puccinia sorghi TaxID=27349 RepID=A0A0L6UU97_9BASI|nr:hypothetical protein VP01_379g4 [Puccinia sorghi]
MQKTPRWVTHFTTLQLKLDLISFLPFNFPFSPTINPSPPYYFLFVPVSELLILCCPMLSLLLPSVLLYFCLYILEYSSSFIIFPSHLVVCRVLFSSQFFIVFFSNLIKSFSVFNSSSSNSIKQYGIYRVKNSPLGYISPLSLHSDLIRVPDIRFKFGIETGQFISPASIYSFPKFSRPQDINYSIKQIALILSKLIIANNQNNDSNVPITLPSILRSLCDHIFSSDLQHFHSLLLLLLLRLLQICPPKFNLLLYLALFISNLIMSAPFLSKHTHMTVLWNLEGPRPVNFFELWSASYSVSYQQHKVTLVLNNKSSTSILLCRSCVLTLSDPGSGLVFKDVLFKVGPLLGHHDYFRHSFFIRFLSLYLNSLQSCAM